MAASVPGDKIWPKARSLHDVAATHAVARRTQLRLDGVSLCLPLVAPIDQEVEALLVLHDVSFQVLDSSFRTIIPRLYLR